VKPGSFSFHPDLIALRQACKQRKELSLADGKTPRAEKTKNDLACLASHPKGIEARLGELGREWDVERGLKL
jgi:hypothetical protein